MTGRITTLGANGGYPGGRNGEAAVSEANGVMDAMFGHLPGWAAGVARAHVAYAVAEEVYALRERHGLTQSELAKRTGVSRSAIRRLEEAALASQSTVLLRRIASALGERVSIRIVPLPDTLPKADLVRCGRWR